MKKSRPSLLPSLIIGTLLGVVVATLYFHKFSFTETGESNGLDDAIPAASASSDLINLLEDERNTIHVFEQYASSVVFIVNKSIRRDFFSLRPLEIRQGSGSGFVWDRNGHIVTNFHVVQNGNAWEVTLNDKSSYNAKLVGYEANKDIAVVKIDAPRDKLNPVMLGSSDDLRVGRKVIAIGNPFGLDQTLTTGVVSAVGREIEAVTGRTIQGVIQTDAAINPGNSGGPLLNSHGELVGINTAIFSPTGSSAGIGFAVPVKMIRRVVPQLITYGRVKRPGLGIYLVEDAIASYYGIDGVIIRNVVRGGAAEKAGLRGLTETFGGRARLGDIIVGINGRKVSNFDDLSRELERYQIGETVTVNILRNNERMDVQVRLQDLE